MCGSVCLCGCVRMDVGVWACAHAHVCVDMNAWACACGRGRVDLCVSVWTRVHGCMHEDMSSALVNM